MGIQSTVDPSTNLHRGLYENISFVYGRAGSVLHVASMGDKVRVTRSTLGRNRKCCCEHQLLLRSTQAARGLGLPRHCQIKRLLCCVRQFAPPPHAPSHHHHHHIYFSKVLNCAGGKDCMHSFSHKGDEGCHLKNIICTALQALWLM